MATIGYFLSCEEHGPKALVDEAARAEQAGFRALWISDHYHPWLDDQGHAPFVWSVIGAIARVTSAVPVTTAVTCPTVRIHPAVVAQAAATTSLLLDGRFALGVGSGEALNEHILGDRWPTADVRLDMLEEAVEVMRRLWSDDGPVYHRGRHYTVENARLYDRPEAPVPVYVSGFGPKSLSLAARIGDGYVTTMPDADMVRGYRDQGGRGPVQGGVKVCWAETVEAARDTFHHLWRNSLVPGELSQELPSPTHFEQVSELVTPEMVAEKMTLGPDPEVHAKAIQDYVDAGFDEVYVSQVGEQQEEFFRFYEREVLPRFAG